MQSYLVPNEQKADVKPHFLEFYKHKDDIYASVDEVLSYRSHCCAPPLRSAVLADLHSGHLSAEKKILGAINMLVVRTRQ